jgi:hypothetical protein
MIFYRSKCPRGLRYVHAFNDMAVFTQLYVIPSGNKPVQMILGFYRALAMQNDS